MPALALTDLKHATKLLQNGAAVRCQRLNLSQETPQEMDHFSQLSHRVVLVSDLLLKLVYRYGSVLCNEALHFELLLGRSVELFAAARLASSSATRRACALLACRKSSRSCINSAICDWAAP
eukprot:CAMPEP_0119080722 /NCGR_PEP_ID=MMETSP1178-20130426/113342_2 /TAXON_ID=33656 /ORGANISM="unid sp, Strain CCMP2000" /LENGTH=121 /DNA_ID=CAMNT_0007063349 /DNA_START=129 /DNA_END=495 /DNA_ORIENTATION=-